MVATHLALLILATPALAFYPFHNWFGGNSFPFYICELSFCIFSFSGPAIAETINNPCVKLWWFNGDSDNSLDEDCSPGDVTEAPMSTMEEDPASDLGSGEEEEEAEEEEEGSLGVEDHVEDDPLLATEPTLSATEPSSSEDNDQQGGGWWFGINGDDLLEEDEAFDEDQASEPTVSPTEENQPTSIINDNQQTAEGDYCALDPNHMMCTIKVPRQHFIVFENCFFRALLVQMFVSGSLPYLCKWEERQKRIDSGCKGCCSVQTQRAAEKVSQPFVFRA